MNCLKKKNGLAFLLNHLTGNSEEILSVSYGKNCRQQQAKMSSPTNFNQFNSVRSNLPSIKWTASSEKMRIQIILRMPIVTTRAFALHLYILLYPNDSLSDSEGPDQTARMRIMIWAFAVRICPNTFSHEATQMKPQNYPTCPRYWDRQVWTNSIDQYQKAEPDEGIRCLPVISQCLDTSKDSKKTRSNFRCGMVRSNGVQIFR